MVLSPFLSNQHWTCLFEQVRASFAQCSARLPTDLLFVFGGSHLGWPLQIVEAFDIRSLTWKECAALEFGKFLE